jgi:hypothetical protein
MNSNLTADQIKRIFAQYWGQRILMLTLHSDRLQLVDHFLYPRFSFDMKLALTPLSSISDEHAIEVARLAMWCPELIDFKENDLIKDVNIEENIDHQSTHVILKVSHFFHEGYVTIKFDGIIFLTDENMEKQEYTPALNLIYNYLKQKGYAVPLFIEMGHPHNGKTAIELDIAIDKTLITFIN